MWLLIICYNKLEHCSIGRTFHDVPNIYHVRNNIDEGVMQVGHTFTIEPIIIQGSNGESVTWPDKWTTASLSGKPSAQFENTLLVVEGGVEELTGKTEQSQKYAWE